MYNQQLLDQLLAEYGIYKTYMFCEMESRKWELLFVSTGSGEREFEYERDWWKDAATRLKNQLNEIEDGFIEIVKRKPESRNTGETVVFE